MPIKAVIFDLDNTLVPEMENYERAFVDAVAPLVAAHAIDAIELRRAVFDASRDLWLGSLHADRFRLLGIGSPTSMVTDLPGAPYDAIREWLPAYRREAWLRGLRTRGVIDAEGLAERLDVAFRERQRAFAPPFDDALAAVRDAAGRYALVLATNGPGDVQRRKLDASGLAAFFPVVVASGDIGLGKPDERFFAHALSAIGVRAADAISVGDSEEKDVLGARSAGVRSVLLDRGGGGIDSHAERVIRTLDQLASVLASID